MGTQLRVNVVGTFGIASWLALAGLGCQPSEEAAPPEADGPSELGEEQAIADFPLDAGAQPPVPEPEPAEIEAESAPAASAPAREPEELEPAAPAPLEEPPALKAAARFAVFGAAGVRNQGETTLVGELGASATDAVQGVPSAIVVQAGTDVALAAERDSERAYAELADQPCTIEWDGSELSGIIFTPGVHCFSGSVTLHGAIVFDGMGRDDAVFVLKVPGELQTASDSHVGVRNCAHEGRVFWHIGGSAALGAESNFAGNVLVGADIELGNGARSFCRMLAQGSVHMDTNHVSLGRCGEVPLPTELDGAGAGI